MDMLLAPMPPAAPPDPASALGRVLGHLTACGDVGSTDRWGATVLGLGLSRYAKLRGRLVALGWARDSGRRAAMPKSRPATVWVAINPCAGLNPGPAASDRGADGATLRRAEENAPAVDLTRREG